MSIHYGAVMAHAQALTRPAGVAGVVAHSVHDPIIRIRFGRATRDLLKESAADLTYHEYPIAHQISPRNPADVAQWLSGRIDSAGV